MAFMAAIPMWAIATASVAATVASAVAANKAAEDNTKIAGVNAQNQTNAALTNKNMLDAKAIQEEAVGQAAARQKEHDLAIKLSRAQAVAAAGGGGPPQESLIAGLVDRGETAAGYDLYSSTEKAKTLRFQGDSGVSQAAGQGALNVSAAQMRENQTKAASTASVIGSVAKAGMMSFAPSAAPGAPAMTAGTNNYDDFSSYTADMYSGR